MTKDKPTKWYQPPSGVTTIRIIGVGNGLHLELEVGDEHTTDYGDDIMDIEEIKRGLRAEIKKRENEQYFTFQTNIREMCKDVLDKLEEQEALIRQMKEAAADIGLKWHDYDAGEDAWEDTHKGKWVR